MGRGKDQGAPLAGNILPLAQKMPPFGAVNWPALQRAGRKLRWETCVHVFTA